MEIRNNTMPYQTRPSFKATVNEPLLKILYSRAAETEKRLNRKLRPNSTSGSNLSGSLRSQIDEKVKTISLWGDKQSIVRESYDLNGGIELALFNDRLSTVRGAGLPQRKNNLLDSFLDLTEHDVVVAQNDIEKEIELNKQGLMLEKVKDMDFVKKVTGKQDPTISEYTDAINKLSDEQVTNYRFALDKPSRNTEPTIDFL